MPPNLVLPHQGGLTSSLLQSFPLISGAWDSWRQIFQVKTKREKGVEYFGLHRVTWHQFLSFIYQLFNWWFFMVFQPGRAYHSFSKQRASSWAPQVSKLHYESVLVDPVSFSSGHTCMVTIVTWFFLWMILSAKFHCCLGVVNRFISIPDLFLFYLI